MTRKSKIQYYFSVDGETEKLYLEHLQKLINQCQEAKNTVKFIIKVQRPKEMVKSISQISKITISHIGDMESNSDEHTLTG